MTNEKLRTFTIRYIGGSRDGETSELRTSAPYKIGRTYKSLSASGGRFLIVKKCK
jgi:hypothetical protein